ncbi:amidase [Micromonospora sp. NPDC047740]|uniref:amidase n=1 Tax=Micromonospora sp. NPDC047740 TaxID=3364254 RepID=UPI0037246502
MHTREAAERIEAYAEVGAFISRTAEESAGPVVAVKDVVDVAGQVTTAGSVVLPAVPAGRDAPVVARIRHAGCAVIGKTNLHELALGPTSENPHFGVVRNPHDRNRVAGGSSGGSAAAVALGMCDWAVGSDTSGSIRIPAALCGVVGVKPTTGTVDVTGTVPVSHTQDTLGPLAPDVATAVRALELMTGVRLAPPARRARNLRLVVPDGWGADLDPPTAEVWAAVTDGLPRIRLPDRDRLVATGSTIVMAEAAARHGRWVSEAPDRLGADVRELLREACTVPRARYVRALFEAGVLRTELAAALSGWDALLVPATRIVAPLVGAPVARAELTDYTRPFSVTGHPVVTLPAPSAGLPVGIQLVGHHGGDEELLGVAAALERAWR